VDCILVKQRAGVNQILFSIIPQEIPLILFISLGCISDPPSALNLKKLEFFGFLQGWICESFLTVEYLWSSCGSHISWKDKGCWRKIVHAEMSCGRISNTGGQVEKRWEAQHFRSLSKMSFILSTFLVKKKELRMDDGSIDSFSPVRFKRFTKVLNGKEVCQELDWAFHLNNYVRMNQGEGGRKGSSSKLLFQLSWAKWNIWIKSDDFQFPRNLKFKFKF